MRFNLKDLMKSICPNIMNDMLKAGIRKPGAGYVDVPDNKANQILKQCGETKPISKSVYEGLEVVPQDKWPLPFKLLTSKRQPGDKGIGDIIHRLIGETNSEKFKQWFLDSFGHSCGCDARREKWNYQYPFKGKH
jgi:hypothetical protein